MTLLWLWSPASPVQVLVPAARFAMLFPMTLMLASPWYSSWNPPSTLTAASNEPAMASGLSHQCQQAPIGFWPTSLGLLSSQTSQPSQLPLASLSCLLAFPVRIQPQFLPPPLSLSRLHPQRQLCSLTRADNVLLWVGFNLLMYF